MGQLVLEFPDRYRKIRGWAYSKLALRRASDRIVSVLAGKRMGRKGRVGGYFQRGFMRWHWFGDYSGLVGGKEINLDELRVPYAEAFGQLLSTFAEMGGMDLVVNPNMAAIFWNNPGGQFSEVIAQLVADFARSCGLHLGPYSSIKYNPHPTAVVDSGFLSPAKIGAIKRDLARALLCPDLIVHYSYRKTEPEMIHSLKYITRATFRDEQWDGYMAKQIHGFRNIRSWGKWAGPPVWESEGMAFYLAIEKLERSRCPDCDSQLRWDRKAMSFHYLRQYQAMGLTTPLAGGYFKVKFPGHGRDPPEDLSCPG
ncbi:unnamed protein product [marine sediment metagenome]|uniref:Uncharacterized protein n=1 Tax=marine sediment metagenome TaxID=412755 RepID=X1RLR1_9ZZZZ